MARKFKGKPGDLIEIFRDDETYQHWVVYIGGQEVVHLVTDGGDSSSSFKLLSSTVEVKCEKFAKVVGNDLYKVNNLLDNSRKAREPNVIVKAACAMVGRELQYDIDTYNSKHFANEMRYGVAESLQFNGKPGDLIEINRGLYKHWAVYIGENEVVHFTTDSGQSSGSSANPGSSNGKVTREKLTDVVGHHSPHINNLLDKDCEARDPSIIVKEACEMVGRELPYDVDTYNCEHFATDLRYGKKESRQFNGKPGDLIEINRGRFNHWAVYIGKNEVVHFGTDSGLSSGWLASLSSSNGKVKREKLAHVVGYSRPHINNLLDDSLEARDPSIIVKEALAMVGRKLSYSVVTYNCEHFATLMRYGKAESRQVKKPTLIARVSSSSE